MRDGYEDGIGADGEQRTLAEWCFGRVAEELEKEDAPDILLHEAAEIVADLASLERTAATASDHRPAS